MAVSSAPAGLGQAREGPKAPGPLHGWAMIWTLLGIFAGGMALNLTPCVYPLIPVTVSYFGGQAAKGGEGRGRLVAHGLCYMMGLALTNSVLGVAASLTDGLMGALLQNPIVLVVVGAVLILFAARLFGLWEMRLPSGVTQAASKSYTGYFGSLFMGLTLGVVAAPCIGPFVLGLLTWVASMGSPGLGFLIFFTLSLGLGHKPLWRNQKLWTINPDGTGEAVLWGGQSSYPDHTAMPRPIPNSHRVMFAGVGHHNWFSGSVGIINPDKGLNYPHGLTR